MKRKNQIKFVHSLQTYRRGFLAPVKEFAMERKPW
jgi:hypothetical protein